MTDPAPNPPPRHGIGFGVFLVLVGGVMLGERLNILPGNVDWLFPVILIAWGAGEIWSRTRGR